MNVPPIVFQSTNDNKINPQLMYIYESGVGYRAATPGDFGGSGSSGGGGGTISGNITIYAPTGQDANQVVLSGTASTIINARSNRSLVLIKNLDTTNACYVGPTTATTGTSMELKAGESLEINTSSLIQGITTGTSVRVAYYETFY